MIHTRARAKELGQFFTPRPLVKFMADLVEIPPKAGSTPPLRILDPGAGKGCLGLELAERLLAQGYLVEVVFIESDFEAHSILCERAQAFEEKFGPAIKLVIREASFLSPEFESITAFDFAILNPPYFKLNAKDQLSSQATSHLFKGVPNIYASFMARSLSLLKPEGQMIAITPRSFANGAYFKGFRSYLAENASLEYCGILKSRKDAFAEQKVLQENVITRYRKEPQCEKVLLSSFSLEDLSGQTSRLILSRQTVQPSASSTIRMPETQKELAALEKVGSWDESLASHELRISTGPIVEHRAEELILEAHVTSEIPLIRMHNVRCDKVSWTGTHRKDARFIHRMGKSQRLLVPKSKGILILKRFTSKEEKRRLVTGRISPEQPLEGDWLALENHLNYVSGKALHNEHFSRGLCILLNSEIMDNYFRAVSGSTQVNATDLRATPLPNAQILMALGKLAAGRNELTPDICSELTNSIIA